MLVHEIEEARWRDVGSHFNQYLKFKPNENLVDVFVIKDFDTYRYIVTSSSSGTVKKTLMPEIEVKRYNRMYDIMNLSKKETLVRAHVAKDGDDILLLSHFGKLIRFGLDEITPIGAKGKGVIGMKLKKEDKVVDSAILSDQNEVVFLSEKNQFKRMKQDEIQVSNRATMGFAMMKDIKSNPNFAKAIMTKNIQDTISLYNEKLVLINVKDVPLMNADQSFSSVTDEYGFSILADRLEVPKVIKPVTKVTQSDEPLKLDL